MCSTTSSKCLCALLNDDDDNGAGKKTTYYFSKRRRMLFMFTTTVKKRTKFPAFIITALFLILSLCDQLELSCANIIHQQQQTEATFLNKEYVKIHPYYDYEFEHIYLNISWKYPTDLKDLLFEINITKLNTAICPGTLNYPTYKAAKNILVIHKNVYQICHKCTYKIEISPINASDVSFEPLIVNYTVPVTADVRNIRAYAFNDEETDEDKGKIKLNVTWDNPTDDMYPRTHSIKIRPLNCSKDARHIEDYDIKGTQNTKLIDFQKIFPGCTYNIEVEAQPSNDLEAPSINYTVPECIGKICKCEYSVAIPKPRIIKIKQISETKFNITWIIKMNRSTMAVHNLTKISFSLSTTPNLIHLNRYEDTQNISNSFANKSHTIEFDAPDIMPGGHYEIKAMIENQDFCISEFDFKSMQAKHIQETPWVYTIAIPLMFLIVSVSFIWVMWKKRCGWILRKIICFNHNQPHIRRIYRSTNTTGDIHLRNHRPLLEFPMEFNNIYIEKEIMDELERGKVDKYEISPNRLQIGDKIGGGAFGQVFEAKAMAIAGLPGCTTVAVKTIKKTANPEELEKFLSEISMLKQIGRHPNIVTLLGCCTLKQPYCMIMEYVPCGDLLHYLRALRVQHKQKGKAFLFTMSKNFDTSPSSIDRQKLSECSYISQPETVPLNRLPSLTETECTELGSDIIEVSHSTGSTTKPPISPRTPAVLECVLDSIELQCFALQIARGMEHLERKQILHRDLAARNVLIDETKTLKISDFGLSRNGIYVNSKQEKVPLRWLSVEAIRDNLYTSKSDVWAYGIVLWEIGTLGGFPYPVVGNHEILGYLLEGKRLDKPENCTDELYELMQMCWTESKDDRPSFKELVGYLEMMANKRRIYLDFSQLNPSYVFPPTEQQQQQQQSTTQQIVRGGEDNVKIIEMVVTTNKSDI